MSASRHYKMTASKTSASHQMPPPHTARDCPHAGTQSTHIPVLVDNHHDHTSLPSSAKIAQDKPVPDCRSCIPRSTCPRFFDFCAGFDGHGEGDIVSDLVFDDAIKQLAGTSINIVSSGTCTCRDSACTMTSMLRAELTHENVYGCEERAASRSHTISSLDRTVVAPDSQRPRRARLLFPSKQPQLQSPWIERSVGCFDKVWLYKNSRLPAQQPPFKVYTATYPLLYQAAKHSWLSYARSTESTQTLRHPIHVSSSFRANSKAMLMSLVPIDTANLVVLAIRGSSNALDWIVNFRATPVSPAGFIDDGGNLVHAGFLTVAKSMVAPIATRLKLLLEENPARKNASLMFTGHSAGGAVSSLLFCHMLSQASNVQSQLKDLAPFVRRVHCVTFGSPPVSLLPLQKPSVGSSSRLFRNWLFFSFVNEGDPIVRADRSSVKNLLELYLSSIPSYASSSEARSIAKPVWRAPPNTLSNAGRIVVLRQRHIRVGSAECEELTSKRKSRTKFQNPDEAGSPGSPVVSEALEAVTTTDEQLREVIFGDPRKHNMNLYWCRIQSLAVCAITEGL